VVEARRGAAAVRLSSLSGLERLLAPFGLQPLAPVRRRPLALIFPAHQAATGRELFVKLLTSKSAAARRDFGREVEILRDLAGCPGLAPLCVANLDVGPAFHACARVQGQSLIEIARTPSGLDVLLGHAQELARWIAGLHRLGIAHRDLSLGHVFIEPSGGLVVVDFGMAWRTQALPATERRLCEGNDVQAIGLILWEMICQSAIFPYRGRGLAAVLQREAALVREAELPAEVRRLLMGCFAVQSEFTPEGLPPYRGFASATDALRAFDL
jgi:serine/threonine protein kinase